MKKIDIDQVCPENVVLVERREDHSGKEKDFIVSIVNGDSKSVNRFYFFDARFVKRLLSEEIKNFENIRNEMKFFPGSRSNYKKLLEKCKTKWLEDFFIQSLLFLIEYEGQSNISILLLKDTIFSPLKTRPVTDVELKIIKKHLK